MRRLFISFLVLFVWVKIFSQTDSKEIQNKVDLFDKYIQASMPLWKTTGLSVAVVKDGKVIFKKGYGVINIDKPQPFTTSTISFCASTTKAMTAACIGMLVDEGKIKWDDKLKEILPGFRLYDPYVSDEITIRDLLRHNAGLGNGDRLWLFGYSSEEIVRRMRYMKPAYSMRSSFIYQNLMYVVAGEVIKKVSGMPWNEFITKRIFQPLGMNHTYTKFTDAKNEQSIMTPHFLYGDTVIKTIEAINFGGYDPAGSVVSCIDDITKWMQFLQDSAIVNGKRLIKAETFAEFFKPQSFVTRAEFYPTQEKTHPHWTTYGFGWFQQDYRGRMFQFHTGSLDGAVAIFGFLPEEKFSIYVFSNLDHTEIRHALMWKATDLWCFNDNNRDWSTELFSLYKDRRDSARIRENVREAKRVMGTKPSLPLTGYTGKFTNEIYGDAEIVINGNDLMIKFPNKISLSLKHWNYDVFRAYYNYDWYGKTWITFSQSSEGKISQFDYDGAVYRKKE